MRGLRIVVENGTDWLTPVATVLAVFVGGLITWVVQSRLAERRAMHEAQRAREDRLVSEESAARLRRAEELAAARVIQGELAVVASQFREIVKDGKWYGFMVFSLPHWEQTQIVLGRCLDAQQWEEVSQAALAVRAFDVGMRHATGPGGPCEGMTVVPIGATEASRAGLEASRHDVTRAWNALCPLTGVEPIEGLLHGDDPAGGERDGSDR